jgi:hypothetical protein
LNACQPASGQVLAASTIIHNAALLTLYLSKKELFCYPSFKPLDGPSGR